MGKVFGLVVGIYIYIYISVPDTLILKNRKAPELTIIFQLCLHFSFLTGIFIDFFVTQANKKLGYNTKIIISIKHIK